MADAIILVYDFWGGGRGAITPERLKLNCSQNVQLVELANLGYLHCLLGDMARLIFSMCKARQHPP